MLCVVCQEELSSSCGQSSNHYPIRTVTVPGPKTSPQLAGLPVKAAALPLIITLGAPAAMTRP